MFPYGLILHTNTTVSVWPAGFAVFISTASLRRGRASSILLMDDQGEVIKAGTYLGPAEDDACGVLLSLYLYVKLSVWKLQCIFCALTLVKCWKLFGTLTARVQGTKAVSETVRRTQVLSICRKKNITFYHLLSDLLCTVCEYSQQSRNKTQSKHRPHRIRPEAHLQP